MKEIFIYFEGGGDGKGTRTTLREGFNNFLAPLRESARGKRMRWHLVPCGGRTAAFKNFASALKTHPEAFNVLLVDAEAPVVASPFEHLERRDKCRFPGVPEHHGHLMVQVMEAWLVADPDALEAFYGKGFRRSALPAADDVETLSKERLAAALSQAVKETSKERYHKIHHAAEILKRLSPDRVRGRARHCDRLFRVIEEQIGT